MKLSIIMAAVPVLGFTIPSGVEAAQEEESEAVAEGDWGMIAFVARHAV